MTVHTEHRFNITIGSDDLAVVNCLRVLSQFSQKTGNNRIVWYGTKDDDWRRDVKKVTFRFTEPEYRDGFLAEVTRLLPASLWSVAGTRDDPAYPQAR
jgi:hypothetical protein